MARKSRLARFKFWTDLLVKLVVISVVGALAHRYFERQHQPIVVGLLVPRSGEMSSAGAELLHGYRTALRLLNASGGVLGHPVEAREIDTSMRPETISSEMKLLTNGEAQAFFGCFRSGCRRTLLPFLQKYNNLLVYPGDFEGMDSSSHVFYTGSPVSQLVVPTTHWARRTLGRRIFVVGIDDVYPRVASAVIERELRALDGELAGTFFIPSGKEDLTDAVQAILEAKPDVIFSFDPGDSVLGLINALRAAEVSSAQIPTVYLWADEELLLDVQVSQIAGDYLASSYFNGLQNAANARFLAAYRELQGPHRRAGRLEESAYVGLMMWAEAATRAKSPTPGKVARALAGLTFEAPSGPVQVDRREHYLWRPIRIARFESSGRAAMVWESEGALAPLNYPASGTREEWDGLLAKLHQAWNGAWAAGGFSL